MDDLLFPPSPPSFFSQAGHPVIEFTSCEVPEQCLLSNVVITKSECACNDGDELWPVGTSLSPESDPIVQPLLPPPPPPPQPAGSQQQELSATATVPVVQHPRKRRGRKRGPLTEGPTLSHVESERLRRERLNRRFCDLRAAVHTVSRMDRASLLADATDYITKLRARVTQLENDLRRTTAASWGGPVVTVTASSSSGPAGSPIAAGDDQGQGDETVVVRMLGPNVAAVRAMSAAPHAAAWLMGALRSLDLHVQHACVMRVHGVTVQDAVVDVPAQLQHDHDGLRAALLGQMLQDSN
ncbi:unnamed protein product [Urochloa humidicola]